MKKKILIIGNGAKEYSLAKKMSEKHDVYITPNNDSVKEFATSLDIREDNISELLEFVVENGIDITIPIADRSINADITTIFSNNKQLVFAPSAKAANIIFDKAIAKKTLYKLRITTPKFGIFEKQSLALDYIKNQKLPFVIKDDNKNSATIITSNITAKKIVDYSFIERDKKIIIEDYVYGTPFSFYAITDGYKALPIGSSITYKHSLEGNGGQLTNGMGACVPNYKLSVAQEYFIMDNIVYPTLDYLDINKTPYLGILGINGILTENNEIITLGWQSFMQDCDSDAILENINEDLYTLFEACAIGSFSDEFDNIKINDKYSVSIVLSCKNKENSENIIYGIDKLEDETLISLYPSIKHNKYLELEASTGPICVITSTAPTITSARSKVYEEIEKIKFNAKNFRSDICR